MVSTWPVGVLVGWERGDGGEMLTLCPVLDVLDVFGGVLQILEDVLAVGVEEAGAGSFALVLEGHGPGAVLDSCGEVPRKGILSFVQQLKVNRVDSTLLTALVVARSMSRARAGLSNA